MTVEYFLLLVIAFLYGIVIGSFLNVCIYRIPKQESIVTVGSHCMKCNHALKWYDLFPIFSFLCLRGKCRYCGTKLSWQYPLVELANGLLYVLIFAVLGFSAESVIYALLASVMLVLSVIDYRTMKVPFQVDVCVLLLGVVHLIYDYHHLIYYIAGAGFCGGFLLLISVLFLVLFRKKGLGMGDVEFMAFAGLCIGFGEGLFALVVGSVVGSVIECIKIAVTKKQGRFPMIPYLSFGVLVAVLWGAPLYEWYVNTFIY